MKIENANLWDYHARGYYVVVPTNIGWQVIRNMVANNMGAGAVLSAATRWPELPGWYALQCQVYRENTPVLRRDDWRLVLLPVKPLAADPSHSWNQLPDLALIRRGLHQLRKWWSESRARVAMPLLGAGPGGLEAPAVLTVVTEELGDTDIVLVDRLL